MRDNNNKNNNNNNDKSKKMIWIVNMACPNELKSTRRGSKNCKIKHQLVLELRKRHEQYRVTVVPLVIGCLGDSIKQLTKDTKVLFKPEDVDSILTKMQKVVLWESET